MGVSEDNEWVDPTRGILHERAETHGDFQRKCLFIQDVKAQMRETPNWLDGKLTDYQQEALDLIATKLGRLLFGDPNFRDTVDDIIGYAKLYAGWQG